jgi:mxaD protein
MSGQFPVSQMPRNFESRNTSEEGHVMKIKETANIMEKPEQLWSAIGMFSAVGNWHPLLAKVESQGEDEGSLRLAEGKDGSKQVERLLENAPERHYYRYEIVSTPMPVKNYVAEFQIEDPDDGTSVVAWSCEFDPTAANEANIEKMIYLFFKAGLDSLAEKYNGTPPGQKQRQAGA